MSRMSVSRSAMAAARYRRAALRGARRLPVAANTARARRAPAVGRRAELRLGEVASVPGEDREVEHRGSFRVELLVGLEVSWAPGGSRRARPGGTAAAPSRPGRRR